MKFFIDTADLAQIQEAHELGILDGVTTNPSLMAKVGIKTEAGVIKHYQTICDMVDGDVSAEVVSTNYDDIIEEGKKLAAIHPNIVVKVPMIKDGVKALKWFSDNGIKRIVLLSSRPDRLYSQQKPGRITFHPLSVVLMMAVGMAFN